MLKDLLFVSHKKSKEKPYRSKYIFDCKRVIVDRVSSLRSSQMARQVLNILLNIAEWI